MAKTDLTAARLRELLDYNPETGVFTRKPTFTRAFKTQKPIKTVGSKDAKGYLVLGIGGSQFKCHQLAWLYAYGVWPSGVIDHLDGCKSNNAIVNLRDVSQMENCQNRSSPNSGGGSGYLGVTFCLGKWQARIKANGVNKYIGRFDTPEKASEAYTKAKAELHVGFIA